MELKEFMDKARGQGYSVEHRITEYPQDSLVITEDDYYHVLIDPRRVFNTPFDHIMKDVRREIEKLKASK